MRLEELSDSRYIKGTDTVERYLLNLVQEYFKNSNIASTTSREYIIKKAVERMREEINFDSIGVLSITLPDGEERTGAVTITLEDLNGEPLISPKLSAFNVNFGAEAKTACEGNDPRLSDARKPLEHQHEISNVVGLEGILSTLTGKVERIDEFLHKHNNKNVLDMLVYTGNNSTIDLTVLDTIEDKIIKIAEEIREEVKECREETNKVNSEVTEINSRITDITEQSDALKQYVLDTNQEYYDLSKKYTDESVTSLQEEIETELETLATKDMFNTLLELSENVYTLAGSMEFDLGSKLDFKTNQNITIDIGADILIELTKRNQLLKDCQIEAIVQYKEASTGNIVYGALPYIMFNNNIDGSIQLSTIYDSNQLLLSFNSTSFNIPDEIKEATIIYNVYSKQKL